MILICMCFLLFLSVSEYIYVGLIRLHPLGVLIFGNYSEIERINENRSIQEFTTYKVSLNKDVPDTPFIVVSSASTESFPVVSMDEPLSLPGTPTSSGQSTPTIRSGRSTPSVSFSDTVEVFEIPKIEQNYYSDEEEQDCG